MRRTLFAFLLLVGFVTVCFAAKPIAKHVVFIGLDGWGAYSVAKADMPNVKKLMAEGSYTLAKRTVSPSSSAPNWASMFMGAGPELHGYTQWGSQKPDLPARVLSHYGMFPTVWGLFRDAYPNAEMGYIYEWDGIHYLAESQAMNYEMHSPVTDDNPRGCTDAALTYIRKSHPAFVGIIYDEPDHVGHTEGHDTPAYYAKLKVLDGYIGEIIQAVTDAGMLDNTIFIVTADHGGIDKGHGGITMQEMETPFIICGKGVKKGFVFSESMMQFDVAPTIAHIFRLKQPQVWIGRPMKQVFK